MRCMRRHLNFDIKYARLVSVVARILLRIPTPSHTLSFSSDIGEGIEGGDLKKRGFNAILLIRVTSKITYTNDILNY